MNNNILNERDSKYESFSNQAKLTQKLKKEFYLYSEPEYTLTPFMQEAIDMIFHEIGCIGNGDPYCINRWLNICTYAKLVINEIKKDETTTLF